METYKSIEGFDGYEISNKGNVKSLEKDLVRKSKLGKEYIYHAKEKILKCKTDKDGYKLVNIFKDGKSYTLKIHRIVAEAFIPNPNNYPIINHKDENPANNSVENLEWCNNSYNQLYGECGYKKALKKGKALIAYKNGVEVGRYISSYDAANTLGCSSGNIRAMLRGNEYPKTIKGYTFKYQ